MTYRGSAKGSGIKLTEDEMREAWALVPHRKLDQWYSIQANLDFINTNKAEAWLRMPAVQAALWWEEMQERWGDEQDS